MQNNNYLFETILWCTCISPDRALEASAKLGGEGLDPFYSMLDGGRDGEFFAELEDYFYYAQIKRCALLLMQPLSRYTYAPLATLLVAQSETEQASCPYKLVAIFCKY